MKVRRNLGGDYLGLAMMSSAAAEVWLLRLRARSTRIGGERQKSREDASATIDKS